MRSSTARCAVVFALAGLGQLLPASPTMASYYLGPGSGDYSYFSNATAWEPGANTGRVGNFPNPGGATWSIMGKDFVDLSGSDTGHGSNKTLAITSLGVPGFTVADYESMIDATLDIWDDASEFSNLGQVTDGGVDAGAAQSGGGHLGDIRVAAWEIAAGSVLAHAFQPGTEVQFGSGGTVAGDAHFDVSRNWVDDPNAGAGKFDLFTVMLHEFGHSLGLGHSDVSGSVMEPIYAGSRRSLHSDDEAGIVSIYGPAQEVIPEPASIVVWSLLAALGIAAGWWRRKRS